MVKSNTKPMYPSVKKKWVKALRSGDFKQTDSGLKLETDDGVFGYCCLGVLTELYIEDHNLKGKKEVQDLSFRKDNCYPNRTVTNWAGLPRYTATSGIGNLLVFLADINDGIGIDIDGPWDFNQIAHWVQENL